MGLSMKNPTFPCWTETIPGADIKLDLPFGLLRATADLEQMGYVHLKKLSKLLGKYHARP
jgi:hypothetical protein